MIDEPQSVKLTEDYLDFATGIGYPEGTILQRSQSGQYMPPGTPLGAGGCIAGLFLIKDIVTPL